MIQKQLLNLIHVRHSLTLIEKSLVLKNTSVDGKLVYFQMTSLWGLGFQTYGEI